MKTVSPKPTLDLAQVDAVIFSLDSLFNHPAQTCRTARDALRINSPSTLLALVKELKACQIRTAIITPDSAKPEGPRLTRLAECFDFALEETQNTQIRTHQHPKLNLFLKACELLNVPPGRTAVLEDSQDGVRAAQTGGFGVIFRLNAFLPETALKAREAGLIVKDLANLTLKTTNGLKKRNTLALPLALDSKRNLFRQIHKTAVVVFLDYDGTLTPIVDRPDLAILSDRTRETLRELANHCTVGIISGRDRMNVYDLVDIDTLLYAGSHGFDISGPKGWKLQHEKGTAFLPVLKQVESTLHERLDSIQGVLIERKKFSVAVHYRMVRSEDLEAIREIVGDIIAQHPNLRTVEGKKLYDFQPRIDWDKGKAVSWLLEALNLPRQRVITLFFGDDLTDEDAFRVLQGKGLGIIVEDTSRFTYATYRLRNPEEVTQFLRYLINILKGTFQSP